MPLLKGKEIRMFDITRVFEEMARVVGYELGGAINWSPARTAAVIGGLFTTGVAAATLPQLYDSHKNQKVVQARFSEIDATRSVIFRSVAECVKQGHRQSSCEASKYSARMLVHAHGAGVEYADQQQCIMNHWNCGDPDQVIIAQPGHGLSFRGKKFIPETQGWVASADDLQKSAPLYAGPQQGILVRSDGRQYKPE